METLSGFDPASQTTAKGGVSTALPNLWCNDAGPGTVYVKTSESTYGDLTIDAGTNANGSDRAVPVTPLPALGSGPRAPSPWPAPMRWLSRTGNFAEHWLGAWVELLDGANAPLGVFEAVERDGGGRLRLAGAGPAIGVASFKGRYRFDSVTVLHGAGLDSTDPVEATSTELAGAVEVAGPISATNLTVKSGAVVRPASGGSLTFRVSGKLTVEAGAVVDVSGLGYQGGTFGTSPGGAPSRSGRCGAFRRQPWRPGLAPGGERGSRSGLRQRLPSAAGGGGGDATPANRGGGVIDIEAGELELLGELRARGLDVLGNQQAVGAGGTVLVKAATLSGGGTIDARGANSSRTYEGCNSSASGGGGRIGLLVETLSGFDPASQTYGQRRGIDRAAESLVQRRRPGHGVREDLGFDLRRPAGRRRHQCQRLEPHRAGHSAAEPGQRCLSGLTPAGGDAWLERSGLFPEAWLRTWVTLADGGGAVLGTFEVVERTPAAGCGWPAPAPRPPRRPMPANTASTR